MTKFLGRSNALMLLIMIASIMVLGGLGTAHAGDDTKIYPATICLKFDPSKVVYQHADLDNIIWGPEDLVEFAEGDIANVFGKEYEIIDSYSRRVRLPTTEYLLVDRVTKLDAKINTYEAADSIFDYLFPILGNTVSSSPYYFS